MNMNQGNWWKKEFEKHYLVFSDVVPFIERIVEEATFRERKYVLKMIEEAVRKIDNDPSNIPSDLEFLSGMRVGLRSLAEKLKSSNFDGI